MASAIKNISGITRGNDVDLKFVIQTSRPIESARLMVKRKIGNSDEAAVFDKLVTETQTASGQITQPGGGGNPAIIVYAFTKSETGGSNIVADADYVYDLELFDGDNRATTPLGGTIRFTERVRIAVG